MVDAAGKSRIKLVKRSGLRVLLKWRRYSSVNSGIFADVCVKTGQNLSVSLQTSIKFSDLTELYLRYFINFKLLFPTVSIVLRYRACVIILNYLASSRRSVSWGAARKTAREKIKKKRARGSALFLSFFFFITVIKVYAG